MTTTGPQTNFSDHTVADIMIIQVVMNYNAKHCNITVEIGAAEILRDFISFVSILFCHLLDICTSL